MRITMCFVKSTLHLDVTSCLLYLYIKTIMKYNLTFFSRYMNTRRLMNYVNVPNYFTSFPFSMHNLEKIFLWICSWLHFRNISTKYLMNTMKKITCISYISKYFVLSKWNNALQTILDFQFLLPFLSSPILLKCFRRFFIHYPFPCYAFNNLWTVLKLLGRLFFTYSCLTFFYSLSENYFYKSLSAICFWQTLDNDHFII